MAPSLLRRRYLIPVSKVCEAAPISLFWLPSGLNELPEMRVEFPFNLVGKFRIAFFKQANHGAYLNSGTHRWGPRTRISALFCRRTLPERFRFVCDAGCVAACVIR